MNDSVFETVEKRSQVLKLDFSSIEFARLAEEQEFSEEQIQAVGMVFEHLQRKKVETTIHTLLKMSRLPLKDPKTFENFDFSVIKGRDTTKLKTLPSLSAIYAHRNLAFIGPAETGKTHLAQAFGYECCQRGIETYFIKMSELRDKFTAARRDGKEASILNGLVQPSCLIIDEVGRCVFDKENTQLFFDLIDRRYSKEGTSCMIFTSNRQPDTWSEYFTGDSDLLCALDRIFDEASVFIIKGDSFRGQGLETIKLEAGPAMPSLSR